MDNIALEFKDVTGKGFGFKLKNVSMTLENGYIYAVTGKNGAGKTTLFNYILTEKKRIRRRIIRNNCGTDFRISSYQVVTRV